MAEKASKVTSFGKKYYLFHFINQYSHSKVRSK